MENPPHLSLTRGRGGCCAWGFCPWQTLSQSSSLGRKLTVESNWLGFGMERDHLKILPH